MDAAATAEPNQDWGKGTGGKKFICCICKNFHAVNKQRVEGRQGKRERLASSRENRRLCSPFERTHMWEAERQRRHGRGDWGLRTEYSAAYYTQKERRREQLALTEMKRNVTWKLQAAPLPPTLTVLRLAASMEMHFKEKRARFCHFNFVDFLFSFFAISISCCQHAAACRMPQNVQG